MNITLRWARYTRYWWNKTNNFSWLYRQKGYICKEMSKPTDKGRDINLGRNVLKLETNMC